MYIIAFRENGERKTKEFPFTPTIRNGKKNMTNEEQAITSKFAKTVDYKGGFFK